MCDSGTNETRVRVYKVHRPEYGNRWISESWDAIRDGEFADAEDGDKITIEVGTMTRDEIDNLPEFEGW